MINCNQCIKIEILCNSFTIQYSWIWAVNFTNHENGNRNEFLLLQGMKDRLSLTGTPELGLKNAITYHDSVDEYGHRVQEALQAVSYQLKKKSCLVSLKKDHGSLTQSKVLSAMITKTCYVLFEWKYPVLVPPRSERLYQYVSTCIWVCQKYRLLVWSLWNQVTGMLLKFVDQKT